MRLLDSNIIIYATDPENEWLRIWLEAEPFAISQISQIEVLGYHQITLEEIADLQEFLYSSNVLPVSDEAAKKAIALRQQRKMSLADSILAGTALLKDFRGVLVSDFYAVYDAFKCPRQKCLIHLMRDINDDMHRHPYDEELREIAQKYAAVLRIIVETVARTLAELLVGKERWLQGGSRRRCIWTKSRLQAEHRLRSPQIAFISISAITSRSAYRYPGA